MGPRPRPDGPLLPEEAVRGHCVTGCGAEHSRRMCWYRHLENLHLFSLKLRQISVRPPVLAYICWGSCGWNCRGSGIHPSTGGWGLCRQCAAALSSPKQWGHHGMAFALPVNASLYKRAFVIDQLRSLRASMSLRYCRS